MLYKRIQQVELGRTLGLKNAVQVNQWCTSTPIPAKYIVEIIKIFPDLNARWFITGDGKMLMTEDETTHIVEEPKPEYRNCESCKDKEAHIETLQKFIARLEELCKEKDKHLKVYRGGEKNDIKNSV